MSKYVSWNQLDKAVEAFHKFLITAVNTGGPLKDYHVIFNMGSVVRLSLSDEEFTGYSGEYVENYPSYRMPDGIEEAIADNFKMWDAQKTQEGDIGKAIRAAYKILIDDGYPFPGCNGSDRFPIPCEDPSKSEEVLYSIIWPNRSSKIANLAIGKTPALVASSGGEFRRYDFMFPQVKVIITPELEIVRLAAK